MSFDSIHFTRCESWCYSPDYIQAANKTKVRNFLHTEPYPDAPLDRLFPTWIRALSLCTPNAWTDQTNPLYDESEVNAEYFGDDNIAIVTTALLHDPYLYPYGPLALNYGGLGMVIAHEITHAFDVTGIETIKKRQEPTELWLFNEFKEEYTKRALCLRHAHKSVLSSSGRQEALNATADSENLADLVGTMISYAAFDSLPAKYKRGTLAGLDMSAEQLFFINTCTKWCAQRSRPTEDYAPYRSRCIVPLMNMPEFSTAFRCAAGSPMNPRKKCAIW
ncbi:neprilysin-1 [Rhipicephalus sanguineus]|uniref:neprilysin-1 n=1 Tax=Rhipicephalus sanguineus TaxID=34632 RepID=UPI0020C43506|nr:neprilysin-1 [Rhipicephalus sanguineus]